MNELLSLHGRTALVAGGSGGIGSAIAQRLVQAGAAVIVMDQENTTPPAGTKFIPCDLTDARAVTDVFRGIEKLDIVVHAAGVTHDGMLWKLTDEQWSRVLRVNLDSAFYLLRDAVPVLRRTGSGASIILVASINGERGKMGLSNYAASKAGLIGLGRTAARELGAFGIRVNIISPGYIRTPLTQHLPEPVFERARSESVLARLGEPDDVARVALFLASDLSRHVTGQVIRVDGGQLIG